MLTGLHLTLPPVLPLPGCHVARLDDFLLRTQCLSA
jgi:hypothetical protein